MPLLQLKRQLQRWIGSRPAHKGAIQVDTGRYNVLLVDDDLVQIDLARRAAAESCPEINLTAVGGGEAVLDWFSASVEKKEQMPHIILLDLKLPKLDGLAVLRKLRGYTHLTLPTNREV